MHSCISDVADFRTAMRLPIAPAPDLRPTAVQLDLMVNLLHEEYDETRRAIGRLWDARRHGEGEQAHALAEVADGLADLIYVACGAALELGIPLGAVWAEVHAANMRKVGGGRRGDGKVLKPEGWQPPDVYGAVFGKGAK